jgi:hypothetical protein
MLFSQDSEKEFSFLARIEGAGYNDVGAGWKLETTIDLAIREESA